MSNTYRYTFKTFDSKCYACPFAIKVHRADGPATHKEEYRCMATQLEIMDVTQQPPAWCPRETVPDSEQDMTQVNQK